MKISATALLTAITLAFAAFVGGFALGRNTAGSDIQVNALYAPATTAPVAATVSPSSSSSASPETTAPGTAADSLPININTATAAQLDLIPGVGPVLAQRIIALRTELGGFSHIEDLLDVKGIGEKTLEELKPYITL